MRYKSRIIYLPSELVSKIKNTPPSKKLQSGILRKFPGNPFRNHSGFCQAIYSGNFPIREQFPERRKPLSPEICPETLRK